MWISVVIAMFTISVVIGVAAPFVPPSWWDKRLWQAICGSGLLSFGFMWVLLLAWPLR